MTIRTSIRAALISAFILAFGLAPYFIANAADGPRNPLVQVAAGEATSRFIPLGIGKSIAIDLPRDIKDVLVSDPKIANAVIRSSRRVYMIGTNIGETNIFFFDANGKQIAAFDIAVTSDLSSARAVLKRALPEAEIHIEAIGKDGVMLSGSAATPAESQQAYDIASKLVGNAKVINSIVVRGRDQVMLKVTVAEVQRDVIKQLGIDLKGSFNYGSTVVNFNTSNPFSANGVPVTNSSLSAAFPNVTATLRALERAGVIRTLAEPNLTAISGETANFLAGGEFPVVTGTSGPPAFTPTVEFKQFGVSLTFTPVVLSAGRISLKVLTEVSELSTDGSLALAGGISIPSLKTRRVETTVEIPSGGSLALAGIIQEQTKRAINGIPGIMEIPVLGTLFKSNDYVNRQSELMVMVTPYVVRAVAQKQLSRPDDGFADPNDPQAMLLGQFNQIYGVAGRVEAKPVGYHGKYGFILD